MTYIKQMLIKYKYLRFSFNCFILDGRGEKNYLLNIGDIYTCKKVHSTDSKRQK